MLCVLVNVVVVLYLYTSISLNIHYYCYYYSYTYKSLQVLYNSVVYIRCTQYNACLNLCLKYSIPAVCSKMSIVMLLYIYVALVCAFLLCIVLVYSITSA